MVITGNYHIKYLLMTKTCFLKELCWKNGRDNKFQLWYEDLILKTLAYNTNYFNSHFTIS